MKKIFELLQRGPVVVALALLFGATFELGKIFGMIVPWLMLIPSGIVLALVIWYLCSSWNMKKRGYLIANIGSSVMGFLFSLCLIAWSEGYMTIPEMRLYWMFIFSFGVVGVCWGTFLEWCVEPLKTWLDEENTERR